MPTQTDRRVLGRSVARTLTAEEIQSVSGGSSHRRRNPGDTVLPTGVVDDSDFISFRRGQAFDLVDPSGGF